MLLFIINFLKYLIYKLFNLQNSTVPFIIFNDTFIILAFKNTLWFFKFLISTLYYITTKQKFFLSSTLIYQTTFSYNLSNYEYIKKVYNIIDQKARKISHLSFIYLTSYIS